MGIVDSTGAVSHTTLISMADLPCGSHRIGTLALHLVFQQAVFNTAEHVPKSGYVIHEAGRSKTAYLTSMAPHTLALIPARMSPAILSGHWPIMLCPVMHWTHPTGYPTLTMTSLMLILFKDS